MPIQREQAHIDRRAAKTLYQPNLHRREKGKRPEMTA